MAEEYPQAQNTDRELWREREGDFYSDRIFVTQNGAIGMDVGGRVITMPIRQWHEMATTVLKLEWEAKDG